MGVSPIFVRYAAADVGPFASAFWRVALALPVLYVWMRLDERGRRPARARLASTGRSLLAGLAFAGDLFFWHLSILATTVANATFFATTAPVFVVLIAWLGLRRQRIAPATLAGLALCLLGGVALIGQSLQVDPARLRGDLYGVATAFFFGLYFIAVGRARTAATAPAASPSSSASSPPPSSSSSPSPSTATGSCRDRLAGLARAASPWPGSAMPAARACSRSRSGDCRRCSRPS